MAQILYFTPQNSSTWTNAGTLGSGFNATKVGTNRYGTDTNGYPYWGNLTTSDAVCVPAGSGHDNLTNVSFEIGFYYTSEAAQRFGGRLYDKAYGGFSLYIDKTYDYLTVSRATTGGSHQNWYIPTTTNIAPGHFYYIQISWAAGSNPATAPDPTIYISVDGGTPTLQVKANYDNSGGNKNGTGSWFNDSVGPADLGNLSSSTCAIPESGYNLPGKLYVFRMFNTAEDFSSGGDYYVDNHLTSETVQAYIEYAAFPNSPSLNVNNTGKQYVDSTWISLPGYQATASPTNRKAALGTYTQWVFSGSSDKITVPSDSVIENVDNFTLEFGFYYNAYTGSEARLFAKDGVNGQFYVGIDETHDWLVVSRGTTGSPYQDTYHTPENSLTPGVWYEVQITWAFGTGPTGSGPHVYINNDVSVTSYDSVGTGNWDNDSGEPLVIGNESSSDLNLNGSLAIFRWYNYIVETATLQTNYTEDSARWTTEYEIKYSNEAIPITFGESESGTPIAPVDKTSNESIPITFDETVWIGGGDTQKWVHTNESIDIVINELTDLNIMGGDFEPHSPETVNLSIYDTSKITVKSDEEIPITFSETNDSAEATVKTSNESIPITVTESNTYKVSNPREYTLEVRKKRITGVAPSPFEGLPNVGWNPFYEPKAIHYEGIFNRTYFGYVKNDGTLAVSQYDHDSKFTDTFILGTPAGDGYVPDDNNGVAITILSDGRIVVVYTEHGKRSLFRYRISSTPEDIMSLSEEIRVYTSDPCTFIQLLYSSPTLIVLYQFGDQYWGYRINNNNGAADAWESQKTLFDWGAGEFLFLKSSWRWNVANNRIADIALSTHPQHGTEHDIYYCYIRMDGPNYIYVMGSGGIYLRNIGGNAAISPITPAEMGGSTIYLPKIYDYDANGQVVPWIWDIYASSNNDIVAVFGIYSWITNHRYGYSRYDVESNRWNITEVVPLGAGGSIAGSSEPYYSGGMSIAKRDDIVDLVHASVWDSDTEQFEVKDFKSYDLGKTWQWVNRSSGPGIVEEIQPDAPPSNYSKRVFKTILSDITASYCQACVDDGVAGLVIWWGHTYSNATDCTAELEPYITLLDSYGLKVWLEIEGVMHNHFTTNTTLAQYSSDTTVPGADGVSWGAIVSAYDADPRIVGFVFEGSYDVGVQFLRSVTSKPLTQCWVREDGYYDARVWSNWYEPTHALFNLGGGDPRTFRLLNVDELLWEVYTIDQCLNAAESLALFQRDFPGLKIGIIGIVSYTGYWEYWQTYAYIAAHGSDSPLPPAVSYETTQALITEYFGNIRDSALIDIGTIFDDYGYTTPIQEQLQNLDAVEFDRPPKNKNIRPVSVINGTDDFSVYWASGAYTHYTDWDLKMVCGASYPGYDLLGVIDSPIAPAVQEQIGSADQLTFSLQLTDPKVALFTTSPKDLEIWYYGRDSRLKQVYSIQSVTPIRNYGETGDTIKVIADGPEANLTKYLIEGEYKVTQYVPSYVIEDLAEEAIAAGDITEVYVDGDLDGPIDIDISWENLKTAVDKVVEQTGGYSRIIVNEMNPAQRVLAVMPNFNVFSYIHDPTIIARRTEIIYDVFPEVGLEITNNGGMGGSAYNGKANINRYGKLTGGASSWNFSNDTGLPAPIPSTGYFAGWRSSNTFSSGPGDVGGLQYQQPPSYWVNVATAIASDFAGYTPGGVWIIGLIQGDNTTCKLQFDGTSDDPNISFTAGTDLNEAYLDAFDAAGVFVWLQVEPADADMVTLIDLVLDQYSEHPCVIGIGIDCEWYQWNTYNSSNDAGKPITDIEAEAWLAEVQLYHSNYRVFLKHWLPEHMPPTQHEGITLITDSQQFGTEGVNTSQEAYDTMMGNFGSWGDTFIDSDVGFQMGYPVDQWWWQDWVPDPIYDFGTDIISWQGNCRGLYWVDFSIMDVYPPDEYR